MPRTNRRPSDRGKPAVWRELSLANVSGSRDLSRLERWKPDRRIIRERTQVDAPPVYVSAGDKIIPEGAIVIERVLIDPPKRDEPVPIIAEEPTGKDVFGGQEKRRWLIDYPRVGIA